MSKSSRGRSPVRSIGLLAMGAIGFAATAVFVTLEPSAIRAEASPASITADAPERLAEGRTDSTREPVLLPSRAHEHTERLQGTLVVFDGDERPCAQHAGYFAITSATGAVHRVAVSKGGFEVPAAALGGVLGDLVIDGQRAVFRDPVLGEEEEWIALEAEWVYEGRFRVVDDETDEDLSHVTVFATQRMGDAKYRYPPDKVQETPVVLDAQSPFEMPAGRAARTIWVTAPGYAWERVPQLQGEPEQEVRLSRGASLSVSAPGHDRLRGAHHIHLVVDGESVAGTRVEANSDAYFDSLLPGEYSVRLEVGNVGASRAILARQETTLHTGEHVQVEFATTDPRRDPGSLLATVLFPSDPGETEMSLHMSHETGAVAPFEVGRHRFTEDTRHVARVHFPSLEPGRWAMKLEPWGASTFVDIPAGGEVEAVLEASELARVSLWVFDSSTEESLGAQAVAWRQVSEDGQGSWSFVPRVPGSDAFEFIAATGTIEAFVYHKGYERGTRPFSIEAGTNDLLLEVAPRQAFPVEVSLVSNGRQVPIELNSWTEFDLISVDGDGERFMRSFGRVPLGSSLASPRIDLVVDKPGRYRLEPGEVPGYRLAEPSPLEVLVPEDGPASLVVALEPDPEDS